MSNAGPDVVFVRQFLSHEEADALLERIRTGAEFARTTSSFTVARLSRGLRRGTALGTTRIRKGWFSKLRRCRATYKLSSTRLTQRASAISMRFSSITTVMAATTSRPTATMTTAPAAYYSEPHARSGSPLPTGKNHQQFEAGQIDNGRILAGTRRFGGDARSHQR